MALKPISETDRLYFELKAIHQQIGRVLREYEANLPPVGEVDKSRLVVMDPWTGKPFERKRKPTARRGKK